ncbi:MAG: bifunctional hydroxymethylpyrimidine kinase/phosphomethylpyrimidine kinase [Burkholderiaceae bacterium]
MTGRGRLGNDARRPYACRTGRDADDLDELVAAARTLLAGRTQWVAVTSAAPLASTQNTMQVVLATRSATHVLTHPRIDGTPKGTADLFCATLTAHWLRGTALPEAALAPTPHYSSLIPAFSTIDR